MQFDAIDAFLNKGKPKTNVSVYQCMERRFCGEAGTLDDMQLISPVPEWSDHENEFDGSDDDPFSLGGPRNNNPVPDVWSDSEEEQEPRARMEHKAPIPDEVPHVPRSVFVPRVEAFGGGAQYRPMYCGMNADDKPKNAYFGTRAQCYRKGFMNGKRQGIHH